MTTRSTLLLAMAILATVSGCGPRRPARVPVSGTVLIDGVPLTRGFVRVVPDDNRPATGPIDAQGRFRLTTFDPGDGCVLGTHPVEVVACEQVGLDKLRWLVPRKYQKTATSGLAAVIDGPTDHLSIKLSWEGGKPFVEKSDIRGDSDPVKLRRN